MQYDGVWGRNLVFWRTDSKGLEENSAVKEVVVILHLTYIH